MPRRMRQLSNSGYMHLIIRGVAQQILFEDREDYQFFLSLLERFCQETEIKMIAYCLMDNHVHLLILDRNRNTSLFMKKLEVTYAKYYNEKYERAGHLFQNRYHNINIDNERSLLAVFRYILNNPVKAGICPASLYKWSSYRLYGSKDSFVDTSEICRLLGDFQLMDSFLNEKNEDGSMDDRPVRHNDDWGKEILVKKLNVKNGAVLKAYGRKDRDKSLRILKDAGLSTRQIERLTGISKSVVQRA